MASKYSADPNEAQALSFMERFGISEAELPGFIMGNLVCLKVLAKHAQLPQIAEHLQGIISELKQITSSEGGTPAID